MRAVVSASLLALLPLAHAGCDSREDTPPSQSGFVQEDPYARQVEGRVVQGTESVPGANVYLVPTEGFLRDQELRDAGARETGDPGIITSTDPNGKYHVKNGPFFYDLSLRKDREVVVFRNVAARYFEPPLATDAKVNGFTASVAARTDPPPAPGHAVAFFVSGPESRMVSGDPGSLLVTYRHYDAFVTLNAVEYVASGGLVTATHAGQTNIRLTSGGAVSAVVNMQAIDPVGDTNDLRFIAIPPPGYALSQVELVMDFGVRTSARVVARVDAGTPIHIGIIRSARYFARVTATGGGAISDSGLQYINPFEKNVALTLPAPVEAAFEGAGSLTATFAKGVAEHVLAPTSQGAASIRILTTDRATAVPDVTRLGLPPPVGSYTWTVQHFPTPKRVENLSGEDARLFNPVSTTAPRTIDLH